MKHPLRVVVSLLLAVAHLLVVTHTTFVVHTRSSTGEWQHSQAPSTGHSHARSTWCEKHTDGPEDVACTAAKLSHAPTVFTESPKLATDFIAERPTSSSHRLTQHPLSVLSRAPKASPPAAAFS